MQQITAIIVLALSLVSGTAVVTKPAEAACMTSCSVVIRLDAAPDAEPAAMKTAGYDLKAAKKV